MKSGGTAKLFIAPSTAKAALGLFVYPGVGPEHAYLRDTGRVKHEAVSDEEAMEAFFLLSRFEGIIPAVESAHAVAYAIKYAKEHKSGSILACLSGRGDKDIDFVYDKYGCGERFVQKYLAK